MQFLYGLFVKVCNMSVTASIVIIAILILRLLLWKVPKKFSYMLWGIVLFRLLCPVSLPSAYSLLNLIKVPALTDNSALVDRFTSSENFALINNAILSDDSAFIDNSILSDNDTMKNSSSLLDNSAFVDNSILSDNVIMPDSSIISDNSAFVDKFTFVDYTTIYSGKSKYLLAGILGAVLIKDIENLSIVLSMSDVKEMINKEQIVSGLVFIWILGIIVLFFCSVVSTIRLYRQIGCSMLLRDNIYLADHIPSPFVLGVLRPRIYLPSALNGREQEYIILHEQCHIYRRDYIFKMLAFVALCLHWFNPFVYLAFVLAGKDMEMSCDEAVMRKMDGDIRSEYAASLLKLAVGRRMIAGVPLAFGEGNPKSRIKNVMHYKKPAFWVLLIAVIVCVLGGVSLLTNPVEKHVTMEWAKGLNVEDVDKIELVVLPQDIEKQYKDFPAEAFADVVALINESRGNYLLSHEDVYGSSIFFYLTMADGIKHEVGNIGNYYLFIDGDYFDAGYDWLSSWDRYYREGNAALPAGFFDTGYDVSSDVKFQAKVLEVHEKTLLVEPLEGSLELDSADLFDISLEHLAVSPQIDVGAIVEISYNGEIIESYPAQLGRIDQILVLSEVEENNPISTMSEEEMAIANAIMEYNIPRQAEGYDFACCSFVNLETVSATPVVGSTGHVITYYGWAMYMICNFLENGIEERGGSHVPVALTFLLDENGYTLQEYWEPRDGSYYTSDIREVFPSHIAEEAINSQKYVRQQIQDCYAQAVVYGQLDTDVIIANLLREICSDTSATSSNPQDYIDAHSLTYRELCYYGDFTVQYCVERFEQGGETGLEGHIMARLCEELLDIKEKIPADAKTVSTGQEWYDALKAHTSNVIEKYIQKKVKEQ